MRHTRDNHIWVKEQKVALADVLSVVPSYALPDGVTHADEYAAFKDGNQGPLPEDYILIQGQVNNNADAIIVARDTRIAAENQQKDEDAATAEAERIAALSVDDKRLIEYRKVITSDAFQEAYFEKEFESKPEKMAALQGLREDIKTEISK